MTSLATARHDAVNPVDGIYADHLVQMITMHLLRYHSSRSLTTPEVEPVVNLSHARMMHVRDLIESALGEDLALHGSPTGNFGVGRAAAGKGK